MELLEKKQMDDGSIILSIKTDRVGEEKLMKLVYRERPKKHHIWSEEQRRAAAERLRQRYAEGKIHGRSRKQDIQQKPEENFPPEGGMY